MAGFFIYLAVVLETISILRNGLVALVSELSVGVNIAFTFTEPLIFGFQLHVAEVVADIAIQLGIFLLFSKNVTFPGLLISVVSEIDLLNSAFVTFPATVKVAVEVEADKKVMVTNP